MPIEKISIVIIENNIKKKETLKRYKRVSKQLIINIFMNENEKSIIIIEKIKNKRSSQEKQESF